MSDNQEICPRCHVALSASRSGTGVHYVCPACGGRAVNFALLRRELDPDFLQSLWIQVREAPPATHHDAVDCASCRGKMHAAAVAADGVEMQIDVCRHCHILWMDHGEMERLPGFGATPEVVAARRNAAIPEAVREVLAERAIEKVRRDHGRGESIVGMPDEPWKAIVSLFGFPVEEDAPPPERKPTVTWAISLVCLAVFLLTLAIPDGRWIEQFGFLPSDPWRLGGLTAVTSFFLHGGIFHLIGNLWFLILLGDNCESLLGRARYAGLLAAGAAGGLLAHGGFDARDSLPVIGASAGISAVMAVYAIALPRVRLVFGIRFGFFPFWIRLSAAWAFGLWILSQLGLAWMQVYGLTHVSAFGHLGGVLAGVVLFFVFRRIDAGWTIAPRAGDFSNPEAVAKTMRKKTRH